MSHKLYCGTRRGIALLLCILMLSSVTAAAFAEETHEHNFQLVGTIPPTCTEPGGTGYVCTICGEPYWDDIHEPLGHDWGGVIYQQPTEETDGIMVYQCSRCGIYNPEYYELIPATGTTKPLTNDTTEELADELADEPDELDLPESDPTADLEAAPLWEAPFRGLMLTGDWGKDLVTIAWTQNGYEESEDNFEMVPKPGGGTAKNGYTRYGAWYGYPYGDWCAMFISFCLNYAGIPEDVFPRDHVVESWLYALKDKGYLRYAAACMPKPGDLVFLKSDQSIDHVGIVVAVDEGADLALRTFEGNRTSKVEMFCYSLNDPSIVAYAVMPDNPNPQPHPVLPNDETAAAQEEPAQTETVETILTGESDAGSFRADEPVPAGTEFLAVSVPASDAVAAVIRNAVAEEMQADPDEIFVTAYQVALKQPNGTASSKGADVTLKTAFTLPVITGRTAQVKKTLAVYSSESGTLETLSAQAKTENGVITSVSFHAPEAATYAICFALSFTEAEPENPAGAASEGTTNESAQQAQEQPAEVNSIPAGTLVQCDAGSFKADKAVPDGTQLLAKESTPNSVVIWTIQNFIQKYIAASEPEEIAVTAYQVVLVSPDGNICPSAAEVTLKTALPLPTVETAGVIRNTQVRDIVAVYATEDGVLHVYKANPQTQGNVITSVSFYTPESSVYAICYTLKIAE